MDFVATLEQLAGHFETRDVRWAVVGGLALSAWGAGRLTHDVDVATERRAQEALIQHLESVGYETLHVSEGYSNHAGAASSLGRIDVIYVDETTARRLFGDARTLALFPGLEAPVARPEHLVAMKVLAAKNDPGRRLQELSDIVALLRATGLDAESIRSTFARHGMEADWEEVHRAL